MSRALGRYELLRPLARGGMAEVFLARRRAAGVEKWLVVKRIRAERANDVQFLDLFVREARLSMSLAHQNIVPVFDFGRIDDQVFLAMERVEGRDLASCLTRAQAVGAPLSPLLAAFIAAECCQALDYAHRRKSPEGTALGIVHRDVTPRNVLLSWSGEVKLTDFGIAALAGDATTALLGTPAYMAPEQARKETLDARTDVYAVGLVLREMLTGERARAGVDRDSLVGAARAGELRPWPAHALPATLVAIVDKATATSPSDRHTDARALLAELDEFLVTERAAKKADSPTRQLASWLDKVWGAERDEESASSGEIDADHMVSFLDDGALDVLGTGTQRSMLATAGDEPASISPYDDTLAAAAKRDSKPLAVPTIDKPPDEARAVEKPATIVERATGSRRSSPAGAWRWLVLALAALIAIGAVVFVMTRGDDRAAAIDAAVTTPAIDASTVVEAPADASAPIDEAEPDAPVVQLVDASVPIDAARATRDASIAVVRDAPSPPLVDAAVAATRRVTINVTPWAYFTVDNDPKQYETPRSLQLAPGRHVIHIQNPELNITKDITLDVPADRDIEHVENLR